MLQKKTYSLCVIVLSIISCFIVMINCGADGKDGTSYLCITWMFGPFSFWTDNPAIPSIFYNGQYYKTAAGLWSFWYEAWDLSQWTGTYKIYIDEGEEGKFLKKGDDGIDLYFELSCLSIGPTFYVWSSKGGVEPRAIERDIEEINKRQDLGYDTTCRGEEAKMIDPPSSIQIDDTDPRLVIEKGRGEGYRYTLKYIRLQ